MLGLLTTVPQTFMDLFPQVGIADTKSNRAAIYAVLDDLVASGKCSRLKTNINGRSGNYITAWRTLQVAVNDTVECPGHINIKIELLRRLANDHQGHRHDLLEIADFLEMLAGQAANAKEVSTLTHLDYMTHQELLKTKHHDLYSPYWCIVPMQKKIELRGRMAEMFVLWRDNELKEEELVIERMRKFQKIRRSL